MKKSILFLTVVSVVFLTGCGWWGKEENKVTLGGAFELNGATVTANYLIDGWVHPSNEYDAPFEGNKAVVVNLTIEAGAEEFSELSTNFSLSFGGEVVESTNYVGITDGSELNNCGGSVKAAANESNACDLVFEVPQGADVSSPSLVYEPLSGGVEPQTFQLK